MVVPPMGLDAAGPRTGTYRAARGAVLDGTMHISHPELAVALLDEIDNPPHRRIQPAVADRALAGAGRRPSPGPVAPAPRGTRGPTRPAAPQPAPGRSA